jgi:hypothetical protein
MALQDEMETAVGLLRAGVIELHRLDGANRFFRLPLLLVSQGLERLTKVALILHELNRTGAMPSRQTMKVTYGHDLVTLLEEIVKVTSEPSYRVNPIAGEDADYLRTSASLREHLRIIGGFGDEARYFDLDTLLKHTKPGAFDPKEAMDQLELQIMSQHPEFKLGDLTNKQLGEFYAIVNRELTTNILRFGRTVARLFYFDLTGEAGRMASGRAGSLVVLRDQNLGTIPAAWRKSTY